MSEKLKIHEIVITHYFEFIGFMVWEELNVGAVPTSKMHNKGTVTTFKVYNIGTVPTFKMHNIGTTGFFL